MATQTTNYNLTKPAQDDYYDVDVFNDNSDKIDAALKAQDDTDNAIKADIKNVKTDLANFDNRYKIGDIVTTARTDLGDNWALCNGNQIFESNYPDAFKILSQGDNVLWALPNQTPNSYTASQIVVTNDEVLLSGEDQYYIYDKNANLKYSGTLENMSTLFYCNGYYIHFKFVERSDTLRDNVTIYYSNNLENGFTSAYIYEAMQPRENYSGMRYINDMRNFFSDGTNCFFIGHYHSIYASVDDLTSWKALDFSVGTVVYSTYIDGYYIYLGARNGNTSDGARIAYTNTSPISKSSVTTKALLDNSYWDTQSWDTVGVYHIGNKWHVFITHDAYQSTYSAEFIDYCGGTLDSLEAVTITNSSGSVQILAIDEQGLTFIQGSSMQYFEFSSKTLSTIKTFTLNGSNFSPFYTFTDSDNTPVALIDQYRKIYHTNPAYLPSISVDKAYAYIKVSDSDD